MTTDGRLDTGIVQVGWGSRRVHDTKSALTAITRRTVSVQDTFIVTRLLSADLFWCATWLAG